jgi:predicted dehydrogenase
VNVGVVGCGRVATLRHLPALQRLRDMQVVALADVDEARLEEAGRTFGVERRYADYHVLLESRDVETVAVCVPTAAHAEVAVAALEAGKNVLVEKPLALTVDDAERIRDAALEAPGVTTVGFNMRHHRLVRKLRELVHSRVLGELQALRTAFTSSFDYRDAASPWRLHRERGGGGLIEMGPHHLDLWRFLTGREVEEVTAKTRTVVDEDETIVVTGRLEGDVLATTLVSQATTNTNEVEVFGSEGLARISLYRFDGFEVRLGRGFGGDVRARLRGLARTALELPRLATGARRGGDYVASYAEQWRELGAAIQQGRQPEAGVEDGVRGVEVMLAALKSTELDTTVAVGGEPVRV